VIPASAMIRLIGTPRLLSDEYPSTTLPRGAGLDACSC
jgi:hypothetical protein